MHFFQINEKLLIMKMHYFFGLAATAPIIPFLSTISKQRGYSPLIVGLIFTVSSLVSLVMRPLVGFITDKYKCYKLALMASILTNFAIVCALLQMPDSAVRDEINDAYLFRSPLFLMYFVMIVLFFTSVGVKTVTEDTICMNLLGKDTHKYGKQRVWGAIGWGTSSIVSGACVDWYSKGQEQKNYLPGYLISLLCYIIDLYAVSKIKVVQKNNDKIIASNVKKLFTSFKVPIFLLWIVVFGVFNSFIWYFTFWYMEDLSNIYHPETKPWIKTIQGFSLTVQCFGGEIPFFYLSGLIIKRVGHMNVFSLMFFTFAVRFFLYSIIKNPIWVLPVESCNGITFALAYSAAISYTCLLSPVGFEGTLQGIVGTSINGIGSPIGSFVGGYLFNRFGSIFSYKILSGVALTTCVSQIVINQLTNRLSKPKRVEESPCTTPKIDERFNNITQKNDI
ncbi:Major facilitator superfamily domain,Major facilitator superfamily associated domain [Cinara cedri]|uniref:Major facilitator superfamily domain,Major facilitator superfamily associated domain n=1 Tax=Cinara cedri TaxID=506608 RepID=A0A5E4N4E8_9HEMI|nr:Major facilitator superfamily domain,Major facilitator superfamily associated domain [Cinara cedri]